MSTCLFVYKADVGHLKVEEQQQQQNLPDESTVESVPGPGLGKNVMNEDDLKVSYAMESPVCSITLTLSKF